MPVSWKLVPGFALLAGFLFVTVFGLPYLTLHPEYLGRFSGREAWLIVHIAAGSLALMTGPLQLWLGISRKWMNLHRRFGYVYLGAIAVSSASAFYLAAVTANGWVFGLGLAGLGFAWVITTGFAFAAVLRYKIRLHREWMIRSYVVTFGFVTFRLILAVTSIFEIGDMQERLVVASWACWAFPLVIAEAIIQFRHLRE